jgi:CHAT domain-containing protein
MDDKSLDGSLIKAYLLGELVENERHEFEKRMMTDDDLYNQVLVAEDELIEEYALGRLSGKEKESFEASFLSTEEGREQVSLTNDLIKYASIRSAARPQPVSKQPQPARRKLSFFASYARAFAAAIIILAVGFGVWRLFIYESDVEKGAAALRSAYRDNRPVESRLTGFDYAPPVTLRGDDQVNGDPIARKLAERILLDEVVENPGSASYHALGQFYLSDRKFDDAIRQFEEALKADPQNARAHSDLGAARLEKGKRDRSSDDSGKSLEEFAKSLEQLNKALESDGRLIEALFNRALLYQEMMLPAQAEEDWRRYLELDSTSKWADEARHNLKLLEDQRKRSSKSKDQIFEEFLSAYQARDSKRAWNAIKQSRGVTSSLVVDRLVDDFLSLSASEQGEESRNRLQMLSYAGEVEAQTTGDRFTSHLARFYRTTNPKQRSDLAQARGLMRSGRESYGQSKDQETIAVLSQAKRLFDQAGDSLEAMTADYWLVHCYLRSHKEEQCLAVLNRLTSVCEDKEYKLLLVRYLYTLSTVRFNLNERSKALDYSKQSLNLAEQIDDTSGMVKALIPLIEYYRYLGNYQQSLHYIQRSLPLIENSSLEPLQTYRHYWVIASAFYSFGFYDSAAGYQKETLRLASEAGNAAMTALSYAHLGMVYGKLQNYDEGLRNVRLALDIAKADSNESAGQNIMAYSCLQTGHLYRQAEDYSKALASYDQAIELYTRLVFSPHLYQAYKGRLSCYIAQKDDPAAKRELQTALGLLEQFRSKVLEGDNRNSFFNLEQSVYDLAIEFEYSRMDDPPKAFEYSEESRARSLLDLMNADAQVSHDKKNPDLIFKSVSAPLKLTQIRERLPEQVQILQYAVLEDKLLIWVVSKAGIQTVKSDITQKSLIEKTLSYLRLLSSASEEKRENLSREAEGLFDILIRPVEPLLDRSKQVCIVPDKILNYIPFGALVSPTTGKYLIEDYLLTLSPSSSVFVICSESANKKEGARPETLLSVGNPRFSQDDFPTLADLPSAGREAEEVSSYYDSSRCLVGANARESLIKSEMERSDVVHLALHSVVDERSPLRSRLVLAKEYTGAGVEQPDGILQAYELYGMKLSRTRLAVLSACQTGAECYYGGEGMISIARPFMAAGVPLIVASLWPVDSTSTAELMVSFHSHRKRKGISTAEALRLAQTEMLNSSQDRFSHPYYWAAFTAIGGYARF